MVEHIRLFLIFARRLAQGNSHFSSFGGPIMKSLVFVFVMMLGTALNVAAQTNEEVAIIQNLWGMEKRALFVAAMKLNSTDSAAFWPVYDKYEMERKDLGNKRIEIIKAFVSKYPAISNEEVDETVSAAIDINKEFDELLADYYDKVKDATNAMTAATFYQIEAYLQNEIQSEIQSRLPFIGTFEAKKAKK